MVDSDVSRRRQFEVRQGHLLGDRRQRLDMRRDLRSYPRLHHTHRPQGGADAK